MLFNIVEIDKDLIKDKNELTKALYIFLRVYIPRRLVYESRDIQEDCIQDTISFIFNRLKEINLDELDKDFNFEKYIFNRARSYVSFWLRNLKRERDKFKEYKESVIYFKENPVKDVYNYIDYDIVESIIKDYNIPKYQESLLALTEETLKNLGYISSNRYKKPIVSLDFVKLLVYPIIDEYIYQVKNL